MTPAQVVCEIFAILCFTRFGHELGENENKEKPNSDPGYFLLAVMGLIGVHYHGWWFV